MDLSLIVTDIAQATALDDAIRSSEDGPFVLGVPDAAKPPVIAALASGTQAPVVVAVPKPNHAAALLDELPGWLGSGLPVMHFPEREGPQQPADPDLARERLRVLQALSHQQRCVIVVSSGALGQRTLSPAAPKARVSLHAGQDASPDDCLKALSELGYRMTPLVERPGDVARRGGILDVYPSTDNTPVRIEFFGNHIESIRTFDPHTQRSTDRRERVELGVAGEVMSDVSLDHLIARLDTTTLTENARDQFDVEIEQLASGSLVGERSMLATLLPAGYLIEHLSTPALLIIDEPLMLHGAYEELHAHLMDEREDQVARGQLPRGLPFTHAEPSHLQGLIEGYPRQITLSRWLHEDAGAPPKQAPAQARVLPFKPAPGYGGRLRSLAADIKGSLNDGERFVLVSLQAERLAEVLEEEGVRASVTERAGSEGLQVVAGTIGQGWTLSSGARLTVLSDTEIFGLSKQRRHAPRQRSSRDAFLRDLAPGDYIVHTDHGIGRFSGLVHRSVGDADREYLELRYAQGDKLYVPVDQVDRITKFVGSSESPPVLTRLGSQEWKRAKDRVRRAVADLARDLLALYASRDLAEGRAFSPDSAWQKELEASFPYVETPDQLAAIRDVKRDMERARPMDRLVCGDVGYGKTEVAVRAAFKAVMDGAQVAVLVPTTILAQQHFNTFSERFAGFPVRVEMLSRFRSPQEQRDIVAGLKEGALDIVVGTHRLLQKDIQFRDLGLVVIDEEQRFGVAHKERLKQMRSEVDVLTLSATPIPRTLHMALSGIRDMSTMETPPDMRSPIKTFVTEYDDRLVRDAIVREIDRGGQVYFVHNRVHDIDRVAGRLRDLVPEAEIVVGHGQQHEDLLEQIMLKFIEGESDVLVCTTIIESGLDIPNVNTIMIHKAEMLGLAQLYQLRGRVGRSASRASAYLFFDNTRALSDQAQKRLQAIFEATELGMGFQIAQRDLEIRGAGNLLGADQSGHIGAVGFDLYIRLLSDAVEQLKARREHREPHRARAEQRTVAIDLPLTAHLPATYVEDLNLRLSLYQRMATLDELEAIESMASELSDRFGPLPLAAQQLLLTLRIRVLAQRAHVESVQHDTKVIVIQAAPGTPLRERLSSVKSPTVSVGPTQVRLNLGKLGERWPTVLLEVLDRVGQSSAATTDT